MAELSEYCPRDKDETVDSLVKELTSIGSKPSPSTTTGQWQVVSKSSLSTKSQSRSESQPTGKAENQKPSKAEPTKQPEPTPQKTSKKRKRKTHKLKWSFILDTLGVKSKDVDIRQASDLHCACFFHAVNKREVNYNEVRNYLKKFRNLMEEKKKMFPNSKKILKLINRYLNAKDQTLPVDLWSPKEFKQCMSMMEGNILIVSLLQRRSDDKNNSPKPSPFAIPASEINRHNGIMSKSDTKSKYKSREDELNEKYPIKFDKDDVVVCERYNSNGETQIVNNENAKMLKEDLQKKKLRVLIWAKEGAMHWGYVNFKRKSRR